MRTCWPFFVGVWSGGILLVWGWMTAPGSRWISPMWTNLEPRALGEAWMRFSRSSQFGCVVVLSFSAAILSATIWWYAQQGHRGNPVRAIEFVWALAWACALAGMSFALFGLP